MEDKIHFDMFITFNEDKTEAYINIRPNSRIDKDNLKESIKEGFYKIKSSLKLAGIVYGILPDEEIIKQLKEYCLLSDEERKSGIYSIVVAKGTPPIHGKDSELIEHVSLKKEPKGKIDEKTGNIDHRNLGFSDRIIPQGKLILTLKKPTKGEPGMNVLGEPIEPIPGELKHKIKVDKRSIEIEEDEREYRYKSKKEGFLYKDENKGYFVDEKVLTKSVDFKIGNIEGKEIEDSTVIVQGSSDIFKDSVKADFKVEAKKVKIRGNVGVGAEIKGDEIEIEGIVDKEAIVEGKIVKVNKFFGKYIKGKIINLKELSSSKAIGEVVISQNVLSSEIIGKEILVLNESRGSKIVGEKFIFVNKCCGSIKQEFVINPQALPETQKEIKKINKELNELESELEKLKNKILSIEEKFFPLKEKIEIILKKYFRYDPEKEQQQKELLRSIFRKGDYEFVQEKFNIEFETSDIYVIKNFSSYNQKYEELNKQLKELEERKKILKEKLQKISSMHSQAMIIIKKIQGCMVIIKFNELEYKFTDDIDSPVIFTIKNNTIHLNSLTKEFKKYLMDVFDELITGNAFKIIRKVL